MPKHFIFIFVYIIFSNIFPPEIILSLLMLHCIIGGFETIRANKISLLTVIYASALFSTYCNLMLVLTPDATTQSVYKYIVPKYIPEAVLIWCIGNSFLFIGYESFIKRSFPDISIIVTKKQLANIFIAVLSLDILGLIGYNINLSFLGGGGEKFIGLLNMISILIFARLWKKENDKKYFIYAIILCISQTLFALLFGYLRQEIILPTLSFVGGYFLGLGKIKYVYSYRIIPFVLIIALFSQLFVQLGSNRSHFIDTFYSSQSSDENNNSIDDTAPEEKEKGGIFDRLSNIAQITNCVKLTEINGFYNGKASIPLVTALVPRVLWPGKPAIRLGAWFAVEIGAGYINKDGIINNSVNMTIPGELYLDFGWIGIVAGCFLFGGLLAMFWNAAHFSVSAYNLTGIMWGGYLVQAGLGGYNSGDLQIIITFFSTYLVFYILKKIIKK
jgi:hypothetical protein